MARRQICPGEPGECSLDAALAASFPASDPVAALEPAAERPRFRARKPARIQADSQKKEERR